VEFENKKSAVYSAKNVGFSYEYMLACWCTMTITNVTSSGKVKHACESINAAFVEKHKNFMCQTVAVQFVCKHSLVSGTERFSVCQIKQTQICK
jgi:hypothetical protein